MHHHPSKDNSSKCKQDAIPRGYFTTSFPNVDNLIDVKSKNISSESPKTLPEGRSTRHLAETVSN